MVGSERFSYNISYTYNNLHRVNFYYDRLMSLYVEVEVDKDLLKNTYWNHSGFLAAVLHIFLLAIFNP